MKRFTATALILLICLSFVSCAATSTTGTQDDAQGGAPSASTENGGKESADAPSQGNEESIFQQTKIDFAAIMSGNGATNVVYALQDEAFKQNFIAEAQQEGLQVTFGIDGTTTIKNAQGEEMVQAVDGTWSKGGNTDSYWDENEFTTILPKPCFELISSGTIDNELIDGTKVVGISITGNATKAQVLQYVQQVKSAGFTQDIVEKDDVQYEYYAVNDGGYTVHITHYAIQAGVSIYRNK
ncbi:MAG: hypothetical protein IJX08_04130 [Clostridia bacterium]|nr:hypothetical protein [Clostridia bacterium]